MQAGVLGPLLVRVDFRDLTAARTGFYPLSRGWAELGCGAAEAGQQLAALSPGALSIGPTAGLLDRLQRTLAAVVAQFPDTPVVVP
jgi:hypothetical protein